MSKVFVLGLLALFWAVYMLLSANDCMACGGHGCEVCGE